MRNTAARRFVLCASQRRETGMVTMPVIAMRPLMPHHSCLMPRLKPGESLNLCAELIQRRLLEVDRLPFREQEVLLHQVVDQPRDGLARGADHVGDRLMGGARDGDVAVVDDLPL